MNIKDKIASRLDRPIKVVQFGEGNFLRAFVDEMLDIANEKGVFDGSIAICKPISSGDISAFYKQDNLYTVILRGKQNGMTVNTDRIITSVSKVLDCKDDYDEFMALARLDSLRFVVSNTTEAGIVLDKNDCFTGLPSSYPGKLTKFLYERYKAFDGDSSKGLIILPVELIEKNGKKLKECVMALCDIFRLPDGFKHWVDDSNIFCSTLVDRIVTGYPAGEADKLCAGLGYEDKLLDVGEPFALWVIESEKDISSEFPLDRAGLDVIFTDNLMPYRERKVRVLNGAHTASVLAGYLYGLETVRDCMNDRLMGEFIRRVVRDEIVPCVPLPVDEVEAFADSVFERFENPYIDHLLLSISLNSVSKWKTRVLPSFKDHYKSFGKLPPLITFSFAALVAFYTPDGDGYTVRDDDLVLDFFAKHRDSDDLIESVCKNTALWGEDLCEYPGFADAVRHYYSSIKQNTGDALKEVLAK